ncbi:MAG TPA: phosphoadenosine phosphosulfate reductase [Gammaproteobacteria bacterium]|nr:phosphoadenosine phosphosulfate reductase [Gammaproteobacteria bacterium]HRF44820.1 phosphoadenylyl-sulfate reductase [Candidatus Competibacteraceae bacterium]
MNPAQTQTLYQQPVDQPWFDLEAMNRELEAVSAEQRVAWALENFSSRIVMTSSFGAQSAVCLHMVTQQWPEIPVLLVDTGYLFPETYHFIDELTERLSLNLHIHRAQYSPAWQEARYGKLWEQGVEGINRYNQLNKVEPMQRALRDLGVGAWISGLRRQQAKSRQHLDVLLWRNGRCKIHPVIDWTDRDIYRYLSKYELPYHPLWEQGYVSIGDVHTSHRLVDGMSPEDTRFFGLKRECGLHEHV